MARRKNKVLPLRPGKQVEVRKVSDAERLMLEKGLAAFDAVVAQANVAANEFVRAVMVTAKCNPEEGWMFRRDKMQWEKHPVPTDA